MIYVVAELAEQGYVHSLHGKGVRIIYQPIDPASFTIGGIESFKESATRNRKKTRTEVIQFAEILCDERISAKIGFPVDSELYYIQRVRFLEEKALILDINMFLKSVVPGLTPAIAKESIYEYIENELEMSIVTTALRSSTDRPIMQTALCLNIPNHGIARITSASRIQQPAKKYLIKINQHDRILWNIREGVIGIS